MRHCKAILTVSTGRKGIREFPVQRVMNYTTQQAIDNDADQFSIDIGNLRGDLSLCLDRDNEIEVQVFLSNFAGRMVPIFRGIADTAKMETDHVLSIAGRDEPSSLAVDSDALFGKWPSVAPKKFIEARAKNVGIVRTKIARMSQMNKLITDGSEKEWSLWYRIARTKGMYMWTDNIGTLIVDKLNFGTTPQYRFGHPMRGQGSFVRCEAVSHISTKNGRKRKVLLYGESSASAKKAIPIAARALDPNIESWRKKSLSVLTNTTARTISELKDAADEEVFESIVGANEIEITIVDEGVLVQQNSIALVNLPEYDITGLWYIVAVQRSGGLEGMTQTIRLRERNFAMSKRKPETPIPWNRDPSTDKPASNIAGILEANPNIRWADSFVKATNEFGTAHGWDFAVFLGALLAMCQQETHFRNVREFASGSRGDEWMPYTKWIAKQDPGSQGGERRTRGEGEALYRAEFANDPGSRGNPFSRDAGVGPMQLTQPHDFKEWADEYGWFGIPKHDELEGGRWNPDSNIRTAARVFLGKLQQSPPANPNKANDIWIGVARYNGSSAYAEKVHKIYKQLYEAAINDALAAVKSVREGSTDTNIRIPGYGTPQFPDATPDEALKAISWALSRLDGGRYVWGGAGAKGTDYDCSSYVTAALAKSALYLRDVLDEPKPGHHGETTYTLFTKGRFQAVAKDHLLPGDLVFFRGVPPEHIGMYLTDGLFIHASNPKDGMKVSSLGNDWYRDQYVGARRVIAWKTRPD